VKRFISIAAALMAVAAVAGGVAYATSSPPPQIHACKGKPSLPQGQKGVMRWINYPTEACQFDEDPLVWNVQGVQGPTGAKGATGATGAQGIPGKDGKDGTDGDENAPVIYMCPEAGYNATTSFVKWMHAKCPANRAGDTLAFEGAH
jgi:hypothetical protein